MVGVTDHTKHVIVDQSGQLKWLQSNLKHAEAAVKVAEGVRATIEKALEEANASTTIVEVRLGVLVVENDTAVQALSQEKINEVKRGAFFGLRERMKGW